MAVDRESLPESGDLSQGFFYRIKRDIQSATECMELRFDNIPVEDGSLLVDSLSQDPDIERHRPRFSYNSYTQVLHILIMPTEVHDTHQDWIEDERIDMMATGFLSYAEGKILKTRVGTTLSAFQGRYAGSRKEPDLMLRYDSDPLPSFVIESGWSESLPRLRSDMRLWLVGGQPEVQIVIILNWKDFRHHNPTYQRNIRGLGERLRKCPSPKAKWGK
ncbi:hypothetical protein DTO280E4_562 [Paecilomyces variotii]|nr:hypothetical protein DTO280E4_562 [Paecilomyces variotii]